MKKLFGLINLNILKIVWVATMLVVTSTIIFAANEQPSYLTSFNWNKLTSLKYVPRSLQNYVPSFCRDLSINSEELKIGVNLSGLFGVAKFMCKPALYVGTRYKVDKWLFNTILSEYQRTFFAGFDKKVDALLPFVLEETDLRELSNATAYVRAFRKANSASNDPEYIAKLNLVNKFFSKIDSIFNVRTVTAKVATIFLVNILVKTYLFKFLFATPDDINMHWQLVMAIFRDPFGIGLITKEAELRAAEAKYNVGESLPADLKDKLSPDFFPTQSEILNLQQQLQEEVRLSEQKTEPIAPADLTLNYAVNRDLPEYINNFIKPSNLDGPEFMKSYWYWFAKELLFFWVMNKDLKENFHTWIMDNFDVFVVIVNETKIANESGDILKFRTAKELLKTQLKKTIEERFSIKTFLKRTGWSLFIDFLIRYYFVILKNSKKAQK